MATFDFLRDDFADNTQAAAWGNAAVTGSATKAETSGQARFTLPSSTAGSHSAYYFTSEGYDLTESSFYINIDTMVSTAVAATAIFDLRTSDSQNALRWTQTSGTLKAQTVVAGVATDQYSVAWNASTYKYLRIRETGGTTFFESSSSGTSWINRASLTNPFAVTSLFAVMSAACGNVAAPGSFRIEDVNIILPALTTNWRWTQVVWPLTERFKVVTLALDTAGTAQCYLAFSDSVDAAGDPVTPTYWSGPARDGHELTSQSTQAAAQAMAVNIPVDGRLDLPSMVQGRVIRIYHRSIDGSSYVLREFYPRRLVQSDDIEAESIKGINIAASTISGDKITATFTITGRNIQTADTLARTVMSGDTYGGLIGYSNTDTYSTTAGTGTYQILWSKLDGKFYAGNGKVQLSEDGVNIIAGTSNLYDAQRAYGFIDVLGGARVADIYDLEGASAHGLNMKLYSKASRDSQMFITSEAPTAQIAFVRLSSSVNSVVGAELNISSGGGSPGVRVSTGDFAVLNNATIYGGLNVGASTSATTGVVSVEVADAATTARAYPLVLNHSSSGTPAALFGTGIQFLAESSTTADQPLMYLDARWKVATHASRASEMAFLAFDATTFRVPLIIGSTGSASAVGFHGATPIAKPTVTGSRGANAALASLLTALANYGLLVDSSS